MGVSHSMNTIRLHLFTWMQSVGEGGGLAVRPVCPTHPDSPIDIQNTIDGNNLSVSCSAGGQVHAVCVPKATLMPKRGRLRTS